MIINRIGHEPFEFKRGDRVRFKDTNVTVIGISEARKMVRVETDKPAMKGGFEVYRGFIYPPMPEVVVNPEALSKTIARINKKNEPAGGWDESCKVCN